MIEGLMKAIVTRWASSAGAAARALVGETAKAPKLWEDIAPAGTATPYVCVSLPASGIAYTMASNLFEPRVQFSIYDDQASSARAQQVADAVRDLYDTHLLNISGMTTLRADPVGPGRKFRDLADSGWSLIVEFDYVIERTR
jgi:hypothetical protein